MPDTVAGQGIKDQMPDPLSVRSPQWTSEDEFDDAIRSQGFREAAADLRWPMSPALYRVVRTG